MINTSNPNLERPSVLFQGYTHFDIDTHRFSGKKSYDGQMGGIPLMYDKEKRILAVDASDNHCICFGASGSKKTRSLVLPCIKVLGCAGESMIINDSKGELFNRMAGTLKEQGYNIITVNFRNPAVGNAWNPLYIPYKYYKQGDMDKAAEFANDIANTLTLGEVSSDDPFWDYAACDCCFGLILLLFRYCKSMEISDEAVNIGNLLALRRELFKNGTRSKEADLWKWASQDELIAASLSGSIMTAQDTMNGILSVLDQKLRSFTIQPTLLDMLANTNFAIEDIGKKKTAVFLITPDEKTTYHRLVALFISQSYQHLIYSATYTGGRVKIRINYILDEFSSLPAIGSDFPSMIAAARSRNIRYLIVAQSKNQLIKRYKEEAATIIANCTNWMILFSRELELLKEVSELCGQKKDHTPNISVFDLQHLSKEKEEAVLLAGRLKPCVVNLLDIDQFGEKKYTVIDFDTPQRVVRIKISFSELPPEAREYLENEKLKKKREIERMMNSSNTGSGNDPFNASNESASSKSVDELVASIDAKIAELEEEERKEKERQDKRNAEIGSIVAKIEKRYKDLGDNKNNDIVINE